MSDAFYEKVFYRHFERFGEDDTIGDGGTAGEANLLRLDEAIAVEDVDFAVSTLNANDLVVTIRSSGERPRAGGTGAHPGGRVARHPALHESGTMRGRPGPGAGRRDLGGIRFPRSDRRECIRLATATTCDGLPGGPSSLTRLVGLV